MVAGPGNGKACTACGLPVTSAQMMMEGLDKNRSSMRFHLACFHVWDVERQLPARE